MTPLEHVTLTAARLQVAADFYDAVLGALGLVRTDELVDEEEDGAALEAVAWGPPGGAGVVWVTVGEEPTRGLHLSLRAPSTEAVQKVAAAALAHGGSVKDPPRRWALYRPGRFSTMVRDPAGNVVEAVADEG